ncbi:hypothetical protein GCM10029976_048970 [Kribbella albertanoniae]
MFVSTQVRADVDAVPRLVALANPQTTKAKAITAVTPNTIRSSPEPLLRLPGGGGDASAGCSVAWSGFACWLSKSIATAESRLASARLHFSLGSDWNYLPTLPEIVVKRNYRGPGHTDGPVTLPGANTPPYP